jgi:hypothetical protein
MTTIAEAGDVGRLTRLPAAARWGLLIVLSALLAAALEQARLPAARLLGPMIAGIVVGANGGGVRIPRLAYLFSQAIVGCLIARAITSSIAGAFLHNWPLYVGVVAIVILASSALGWLLSRWRVLPGTTAVWGTSPGAATAMMLMAEAHGADPQLVAFMQYLRVVFVALVATAVARFSLGLANAGPPPAAWLGPVDWPELAETLAIAVIGAGLGWRLRVPAGGMLVPLVAGAALHLIGWARIELPPWLLAASYAALGWNIGLGFTRRILRHASRALAPIVVSTLALIAFCGLAFVLARVIGVDLLTAYLASSPGGMDTVAIIAASSKVDVSFVMALQTARLAIVLLVGPWLARLVAAWSGQDRPA